MTKRPENFWRRWAHRAGRLLVRAYLYPMKCLFASTREDNSLAGKARRALIRSIVADTQMMNRLLDPDSSEVFAALRADDMALLRRLLGAKDHIFFVEYLDRLDTHAFEALKAFLRKDFTVLRKTVLDDEAGPLKMLLPPGAPELKELMLSQRSARLNALLPPGAPELKELMLLQGTARLKMLLPPGSKELHALVLSDNAERLRLVLCDETAPKKIFRAVCEAFPPGDSLLYQLMGADGAVRLQSVLAEGNYRLAVKVLGVRSPVLEAVLGLENQKALRVYLFDNEFERLVNLLESNNNKPLRHLLTAEKSPLLRLMTKPDESKLLSHALFVRGLMHAVAVLPLARAWCDFERGWERLEPWADRNDSTLQERLRACRARITGRASVNDTLLDVLYRDGHLHVFNGRLKFTDRDALYTLLQEILVNQDYFAPIDGTAPRIIDCGAHQGISLYYFKTIFPDARIIAFEPDPANRAVALENMDRNGFADVEILPYALAAREGRQVFHVQRGHSMAGSLTERRAQLAEHAETMETYDVQCVKLSPYLQEEVDYLKIDIEGVEDEVLEEAAPCLHRVRYLFCEYHHGLGLTNDRLIRILDILEKCGFDTQVAKSYNFSQRTRHKPMNYVGEYYSSIIFARRR